MLILLLGYGVDFSVGITMKVLSTIMFFFYSVVCHYGVVYYIVVITVRESYGTIFSNLHSAEIHSLCSTQTLTVAANDDVNIEDSRRNLSLSYL